MDILVVDSATGNVDGYRNAYKDGDDVPSFQPPVRILNRNLCPQTGPDNSILDRAVRFGDLDGDGRADYICMLPDGRTLGWLNKPNSLESLPATLPNQIKISEGYPRHELRFADVNGDGKVDLIAVVSYNESWYRAFAHERHDLA